MSSTGMPLHHATVVIPRLGRSVETDANGRFQFIEVPPGSYDLAAHMHHLTDERKTVEVTAGGETVIQFRLRLAPVHEEITVTASGRVETTLEAFQSVTTLESLELSTKAGSTSLGELLGDQTGIAKRSFGPGSSRPVVRGFDGDRVLVLEDGVRSGTLSSQSGDHGEPIDASSVERVEIVRGPATLLYGSNALGGVVNVVSSHHQLHRHPHQGLRGHISGGGGSNNGQGGGSGNFEYGVDRWLLWGGGGGRRTGEYSSAEGKVPNSETELKNATIGLSRYSENASFGIGYEVQDGRYGVPFATEFGSHDGSETADPGDEEQIDVSYRRHRARLNGSVHNLGRYIEQFTAKLNYTDWNHRELEGEAVGTEFFNKQFIYRGEFEQRAKGALSGSFGFWGMRRDYEAVGAEALTPPVDQNAIAAFALEQLSFERFRVQFGGRLERNGYDPVGLAGRSFTGVSAGAGIHVPLWRGGAFVTNYTHSYRAPALEELYNKGPHVGNVTFEVGNPNLRHETGDGVDLSLRHQTSRLRSEINFFYYRMGDFIFLSPTGRIEDGLPEAETKQGNSRFVGVEAKLQARLHPNLWLNLGLDTVDARLTDIDRPLPRIPPLRGRAGFDIRYGGLGVKPELQLVSDQSKLAPNETRTAGYAIGNLEATYTITKTHTLHVFGVNTFNLNNRLYRNHLSFIKQFAPEMGRGARFSYTVHFF